MLTNEELKEIEDRCNAATEGPYFVTNETLVALPCSTSPSGYDAFEVGTCDGKAAYTAEFLASTRTDVPKLIAEIHRLKREIRYP